MVVEILPDSPVVLLKRRVMRFVMVYGNGFCSIKKAGKVPVRPLFFTSTCSKVVSFVAQQSGDGQDSSSFNTVNHPNFKDERFIIRKKASNNGI